MRVCDRCREPGEIKAVMLLSGTLPGNRSAHEQTLGMDTSAIEVDLGELCPKCMVAVIKRVEEIPGMPEPKVNPNAKAVKRPRVGIKSEEVYGDPGPPPDTPLGKLIEHYKKHFVFKHDEWKEITDAED